eukprot:2183164-Amphidinium_carterae.3
MDREEYVNMFSSSASAQKPKPPPPPPPKAATTKEKAPSSTFTEPTMKVPPPPKGAPTSSSSSGTQFGFTTAPKPPPPMHVKGAVTTRTKPLGEIIGTTWSGCYGELLSDSPDVLADFEKTMPQRASRLSMFSDQDANSIPEGHPSAVLWPRKANNTKNCFAITSSFDWKARGPTIKDAQKSLYLSLEGPLTVRLDDGEVDTLPIIGTSEKLSGYVGPSLEAYDMVKAFDYLLGFMLDHEYDLLDIVRQRLESRIARLTNEELMHEGAAWFGWHTERWEHNPIHFIPTTVYNSHEYVKVTSEDAHFADVSWESIFEHLWH